jgi:hypothetical protein
MTRVVEMLESKEMICRFHHKASCVEDFSILYHDVTKTSPRPQIKLS